MKNIKGIVSEILGGSNSSIDVAYHLEIAKLDAEMEMEIKKLKSEHNAKIEKLTREFNADTVMLERTRQERRIDIAMKYYKLALEMENENKYNENLDINILDLESQRFGIGGIDVLVIR